MKKYIFSLIAIVTLLISSCEMWHTDIVGFLDKYTNTAAIDRYELDGSYPSEHIPTTLGGDRVITFVMRNPQNYELDIEVDWSDAFEAAYMLPSPYNNMSNGTGEHDEYFIEQTEPSILTLTLYDHFLSLLDGSTVDGIDTLSATIHLTESVTGRVFESFSFDFIVNSLPSELAGVEILKTSDGEKEKYVLGFTLPGDSIHQDITALTIAGKTLQVNNKSTFSPSNQNERVTLNGVAIPRPSSVTETDDSAKSMDNSKVYYITDDEFVENQEKDYTIQIHDNKGLSVTQSTNDLIVTEVYVNPLVQSSGNGLTPETALKTYDEAYNLLKINGGTVYVMNTIPADSKNYTGKTNLANVLVIRDAGFKGALFSVTSETLTLSNITIDGNKDETTATAPLISVTGGTLNLNSGTTLQNNNYSGGDGGGVNASGSAIVNASGATIQDNNAFNGGGINGQDSAKINVSNVTLSNNTAYHGAAICTIDQVGTTINITGGSIDNNTANHAAVFAREGILNLDGASITENHLAGSGDRSVAGIYEGNISVKGSVQVSGNTGGNVRFNNNTHPIEILGSLTESNIDLNPTNPAVGAKVFTKATAITDADISVFAITDRSDRTFIHPLDSANEDITTQAIIASYYTVPGNYDNVQDAVGAIGNSASGIGVINITGNTTGGTANEYNSAYISGARVIIKGSGNITPSGSRRVMAVMAGAKVTLAGSVNLTGADKTDNGMGVWMDGNSVLIMKGYSKISGNVARGATGGPGDAGTSEDDRHGKLGGTGGNGLGGGVYIVSGTLSMTDNASITGNTVYGGNGGVGGNGKGDMENHHCGSGGTGGTGGLGLGGGVYIKSGATLKMSESASITGNTAQGGTGGTGGTGGSKHDNWNERGGDGGTGGTGGGAQGGGIYAEANTTVTTTQGVASNKAKGGNGGSGGNGGDGSENANVGVSVRDGYGGTGGGAGSGSYAGYYPTNDYASTNTSESGTGGSAGHAWGSW